MRDRFPWGLTIVCALAIALLCGLGVWQVQRMQWKDGLIAQAEAAATMPPLSDASLTPVNLTDFRRVVLMCPGLASAPFMQLQSIVDGRGGVRLISACEVPSLGGSVLVDRGFVSDEISARPPIFASQTPVRIEGQFRKVPKIRRYASHPGEPPERFFRRDELEMSVFLNAGPVPGTVFATTSSNPEWQALQPSAPPAAFSNNHLGYAITWFGLALALAGFYIALLRRKLTS